MRGTGPTVLVFSVLLFVYFFLCVLVSFSFFCFVFLLVYLFFVVGFCGCLFVDVLMCLKGRGCGSFLF